jgi:hypothetical protein
MAGVIGHFERVFIKRGGGGEAGEELLRNFNK